MKLKKSIIYLFTVFLLSCLTTNHAFAQSSDPSPTPISYDLSYPGLLPDHPLYFLKMARDNVMSFFIGNPVDKASFLLLQSDQHVAAFRLMIDEKKDVTLAHSSCAQAQDYFEDAIASAIAAKKEGMSTDEIVKTLQIAGKKHLEVLTETTNSLPSDEQKQFADDISRAQKLESMATNLKP